MDDFQYLPLTMLRISCIVINIIKQTFSPIIAIMSDQGVKLEGLIERFLDTRGKILMAKLSSIKMLILYLCTFYFVWFINVLWAAKYIFNYDQNAFAFTINVILISLFWNLPAWLYIKYYLNVCPSHYLKMNVNVKKGLFWGGFLSLLIGIGIYISKGHLLQLLLPFKYLNALIMFPIAEEIVFRGLILQEINKKLAFWKANIVTASLFLLIHYQGWIYKGTFFELYNHVFIFGFGLLCGFMYKKTGSLWSVIVLHVFNNFFSLALNG
jgi:uncharacterized protein